MAESSQVYVDEFEETEEEFEDQEPTRKYLTFNSDGLQYALDADFVHEIIMTNNITRVPRIPDYIAGIINLRGQIIPIMDIRLRMGRSKTEFTEETCVIVSIIGDVQIGILVDNVYKMIDIKESQISTPPLNRNQDLVNGIVRMDDEVILLLSAEELIRK